MSTLSIEERIQRLEDIEAIKNLKSRWSQLIDGKYTSSLVDGEKDLEVITRRICELYTDDAIQDAKLPGFKPMVGKEGIFEFLSKANFNFTAHFYCIPDIEILGPEDARARWLLFDPCARAEDGVPIVQMGFTDDEYKKVDGQWLFRRMMYTPLVKETLEKGWYKPERT